MGNCDPYSDSPEPLVVRQPKFTRVEEPTLLCNQVSQVPSAETVRSAHAVVSSAPDVYRYSSIYVKTDGR